MKSFALHPDAAAIITNIITFELNDENGRLEFSDEVLMKPGKYGADWFFRNIYLGKAGGAGFISFLRREDSIIRCLLPRTEVLTSGAVRFENNLAQNLAQRVDFGNLFVGLAIA